MSKRYYLSDIVGDGAEENPFRPAVADLGVAWVGSIPTGPDGRPLHTWALVLVATKNHVVVRADPRVDELPDFPLDGKVSAINAVTRAKMENAARKRGLQIGRVIEGKDGYREVIRAIGREHAPNFSEDNFDIQDAG